MSEPRISDQEITDRLKELEAIANEWGMTADSVIGWTELADLRDARARIRELETLSASQAEALDQMEAGNL